jgi:hypothetical protein
VNYQTNSEFKIYSLWGFAESLIFRLSILALIYFLTTKYNENPQVIKWLVLLCFSLFCSIGSETYYITSTQIKIKSDSIINLIFKPKIFSLQNVTSAEIQKANNGKLEIFSLAILITVFKVRRDHSQKCFFLNYKNGTNKKIITQFDLDKVEAIVETINKVIQTKKLQ